MGQQQLLLVILVTIIVGIATVVAINIFGSSATQANEDAVRQDMATIGTMAQAWYARPAMLGGGGRSYAVDPTADPVVPAVTFAAIGFPCDEENPTITCTNANGVYTISNPTTLEFVLEGDPNASEVVFTSTVGASGTFNITVKTD